MPAAGWAPRPLCGKCFHWKTSPPTECLQTQLLSSKAASTTDWDLFLMQIHIILLGNSRCSAMLSFRKIRTLLSPPPPHSWLPVCPKRSSSAHTWVPPELGRPNRWYSGWGQCKYDVMWLIGHSKSYTVNAHSGEHWLWFMELDLGLNQQLCWVIYSSVRKGPQGNKFGHCSVPEGHCCLCEGHVKAPGRQKWTMVLGHSVERAVLKQYPKV